MTLIRNLKASCVIWVPIFALLTIFATSSIADIRCSLVVEGAPRLTEDPFQNHEITENYINDRMLEFSAEFGANEHYNQQVTEVLSRLEAEKINLSEIENSLLSGENIPRTHFREIRDRVLRIEDVYRSIVHEKPRESKYLPQEGEVQANKSYVVAQENRHDFKVRFSESVVEEFFRESSEKLRRMAGDRFLKAIHKGFVGHQSKISGIKFLHGHDNVVEVKIQGTHMKFRLVGFMGPENTLYITSPFQNTHHGSAFTGIRMAEKVKADREALGL